jgi:ABC-type Fe3+/spermidine/putrescine transport system ATPase subunit
VGEANLLEARVEADTSENGSRAVSGPMGSMACSVPEHVRSGEMVTLMFRPDSLTICKDLVGHGCNAFPGRVEQVAFVGSKLKYEIQVGSSVLLGEISSSVEIKQGDEVVVEIPSNRVRVFAQ